MTAKPCLYHKRFSFSKIQPFFAKIQPKNRLALFSCRGYPSHMKLHTSKHVCTNFGALIRICTIVTPIYPTNSITTSLLCQLRGPCLLVDYYSLGNCTSSFKSLSNMTVKHGCAKIFSKIFQ